MKTALAASMLCAGLAFAQTAATAPKPAAPKAPLPSYKDLKYPPLPEIKIPNVTTYTLANGIRVYLLEDHELPLVSGFALVRTGNLFDPPDKVGLAEVTGSVMRTGGTKTKTGNELDVQLENIAASVESSIGESSGQVSFSTLRENTDEVLGVFHDVLTEPEFRQDKIDLLKMQLKSAISRRNDEPHAVAGREFASLIYGKDTPYGWQMEYATVDHIQRPDLLAFYRRYYFPANIMLAVYGDFSIPDMKGKIEKLFGGWNYQQPPVPPFPNVRNKPDPGMFLAVKQDVTQAFFNVGHLGGTLRDKNAPALQIMADILGGGFSSRLFRLVRTKLGYAYGVGADWGVGYNQPGMFAISGSTKSATIVPTLEIVRQEVERMRTTEVTPEELKTSKDTVLNGFIFNFDTPGKTLSRMVRYDYYGYPKDFIFQYQKALSAVTRADVLRVAKEYLKPEVFTYVTVGNPQEFGKPLTALGMPVRDIDLTIPEPKPERAAAPGPASAARGRELLQKAQQAVGGADKLAAVKDVTSTAEVTMFTQGQQMKATEVNRWLAPDIIRQEIQMPFGKMTTFFDGKAGWISGPQGSGPLPPPVIRQASGEAARVFPRLLLSDRDPDRTIGSGGDGIIQISDKQGHQFELTVNENTGMPLNVSYPAAELGSPGVRVQEIYDAWTEVDGLKWPKQVTINRGGTKFAEAVYSDIKINTGLTLEALSKRP